VDFNLNEQERALQRVAKEFAAKVVRPRAADIDRSGQFPFDLAREIGVREYRGLPLWP
jgi:short/branched chain acyl-CoA dehydrogenase